MILSILGLGCKGYFSEGFNIFDSIIVVISLVDLTLMSVSNDENPKIIKSRKKLFFY